MILVNLWRFIVIFTSFRPSPLVALLALLNLEFFLMLLLVDPGNCSRLILRELVLEMNLLGFLFYDLGSVNYLISVDLAYVEGVTHSLLKGFQLLLKQLFSVCPSLDPLKLLPLRG